MRLKVRVGREAWAWLKAHPDLHRAFAERLGVVCADELMLVNNTSPLHMPGRPYMERCFEFGGDYLAVLEWNHAA